MIFSIGCPFHTTPICTCPICTCAWFWLVLEADDPTVAAALQWTVAKVLLAAIFGLASSCQSVSGSYIRAESHVPPRTLSWR